MDDTEVVISTVEPRATIVIAVHTTWAEYPQIWRDLLSEVYGFVRGCAEFASAEPGPRWRNVMLYLDDQANVEVGVLAPGPFTPTGRVTASALPGGTVATAVHRGDYAELGRTHSLITRHLQHVGLEPAGPRWEVYGHWHEDPAELETEISYLLAP